MFKNLVRILLLAALVFEYGCTVISVYGPEPVDGTVETSGKAITITSIPSWASFRVVGDPTIYNTPAQIDLAPDGALVRLEKDNYEPVLLRISRFPMPRASGSTLTECPPNMHVEALSEAHYRVVADTVIVTLDPISLPQSVFDSPPIQQAPLMEEPKQLESKHVRKSGSKSKSKSGKLLKAKLLELDRMKKEGEISAEEYEALKKKALEEHKQKTKKSKKS